MNIIIFSVCVADSCDANGVVFVAESLSDWISRFSSDAEEEEEEEESFAEDGFRKLEADDEEFETLRNKGFINALFDMRKEKRKGKSFLLMNFISYK